MQYFNRKAKFNYELLETVEAGVALEGSEAKAIRLGRIDLTNSYAKVVNGEIYLINLNIPIPGKKDYTGTRTRKLLLHKSEIVEIESKIKAKKLTIVPVKMYNKGRLYKISLALAKSKRKFEKKETIKKRDLEKEVAKEYK